jgi:chemotaxis protein methyltransferase CheR
MGVSVADFEFVRRLVHEHSSIALADGKEYLVEARLAPVAEQEGLDSVGELVRMLRSGAARVTDAVVHAMTTNETSFFRDLHPFDALRDTVIPTVLAANGGRQLSMWSAAASTGQEAYSMALVVREHFAHVPDVRILATDLSTDVLARAARGTYTQLEVNRGLPASLLVKHFERDGRDWQLKPSIRSMVTFAPLNLARPLRGIPPMDIVFVRNVLIYFKTATKAAVLAEMSRVLRPGGFLFLGAAETTIGIDDSFERVQVGRTACYQLTGRGTHGQA